MASKPNGHVSPAGDAFDPYHRWLGIPPSEQPANHYRLLGLALLESDPNVIESAADRQMAHVRTYASGQHSAASQRLLNELAAAKLCLLSPTKKAAYDGSLATPATPSQTSALPSAAVPAVAMAPIVAAPVPIAMPAYAVAPVPVMPIAHTAPVTAAPAPQEPSLATERWLANERSKAAFYKLVTRSLVAVLGAVPACIVGYSMWQKNHADLASFDHQPLPAIRQQNIPPVEPSQARTIERRTIQTRVITVPSPATPTIEPHDDMNDTADERGENFDRDAPIFTLPPSQPTEGEQHSIEEVAAGLASENPVIRRAAIDKLGRMSDAADAAATALAEFVRREPDVTMKMAAVRAIAKLGGESEEAVDMLAEVVSGDTAAHVQVKSTKYPATLRREALKALGELGPAARPAIPVVLRIMELAAKNVKGFHQVFCEAADCLAQIGDGRKETTVALTRFSSGRGFNDVKSPYLRSCRDAAERALNATVSREARELADRPATKKPGDRKTLADD